MDDAAMDIHEETQKEYVEFGTTWLDEFSKTPNETKWRHEDEFI